VSAVSPRGRAVETPVLEVEGLYAEFRLRSATVRAVDGVSFDIRAGECVGLVGESGCGKTTVGLSVMRLLPNVGHVTGGAVRLLGRDLVPLPERELRQVRGDEVAMIFQDPMSSLNPTWTVGRQIVEAIRLHRPVSQAEARTRALELLGHVGVPHPAERLHSYPHQLSGGLRQRVMIAMALACSPRLLIADEPTTALDVTIQAQILDLIDRLRDEFRMSVLLITHDLGVVAARTDRVLVMYAGKVVESARTDALFRSMRHPYSEALLEAIPRPDQDRSRPLLAIPGRPPDLSRTLVGCRFAPRCSRAEDGCRTAAPPLERVDLAAASNGDEHRFACFHPLGDSDAPDAAPPPLAVAYVRELRAAEQARPAPEVVLEVEHLVKEFPVTSGAVLQRRFGSVKAVTDVTFAVRRGETFGLVGESGSGKTTIGRLIVALERPTGGVVRFEGTPVSALRGAELRRRRRELQLMFQDPYASLDPRMRVRAIVGEPLAVQGIGTRRGRLEQVRGLLDEVGLARASADLYPHEFSGGQRQRIGLARALALHPRLIVADEPVSALDVSIQAQILNLMRNLQRDHELTYVVISHDLAVVRYLADTIGVMYLGKLVEVGPANDVYERAAHPYTQALIDAIAVPDPIHARRRRVPPVEGELPSALSPPSGCRFRTRCRLAQDLCAIEEPPLRPFGQGQLAACHFPLRAPEPELAQRV
jgi:peptide/nickel transport system ATP-binding protein